MPFINMTIKEGCPEEKIERCMKDMSNAIAENLDNTKLRMVRVTVMEILEKDMIQGDETPESWHPCMTFDIGPGRSEESIQRTMKAIVESCANALEIDKRDVNLSIIRTPNELFTIAGEVK